MQHDDDKAIDRALLDQRLLTMIRENTAGRFLVIDNPAFLPTPFFLLTAPGETLENVIASKKLHYGTEAAAEMKALCSFYDGNMVIRDNGNKTYHYSAAVERRRLDLLQETIKSGLPKDVFQSMEAYRKVMEDLWEHNKQPFNEVHDAEYLPFMIALLKKKHPGIPIKTFAGMDWITTWLQTHLDTRTHVISIVNAGNHLHQCALSLYKNAGKSSIIVLDSIHWTWNWHWKDDYTRINPAPGYKAVLDFAHILEKSPDTHGAYISMNVQKSPMNCAVHGIHFMEQIHEHADFFIEMHENLQAARLPHPLAQIACAPLPYAREVAGLESNPDAQAEDLLRAYGSAYCDNLDSWEMLPKEGSGEITLQGGIIFHNLGNGSHALHLTSMITALAPDIDLVNGSHLHFFSEGGSLRKLLYTHKPAA
jgi:hypothetical protein